MTQLPTHRSLIFPSSNFLTAILASGLLLFGCGDDSSTPQKGENKIIPAVEAVQARFGALPLTQRLSGVVKAKNQVEIYPEISAALVEEVYVQNGEVVKRGQPLLRLRDKEFRERLNQARAGLQIAEAQLRQAEARLQEVRAELQRQTTLADQGLISATELETVQTRAVSAEADMALAQARVEQSRATVKEREESLAQTVVRAPVDGNVGNRNAEVGMLVSGSTRLFTLGQLDNVRVEVVLTDRMLTYIEAGQRTEVFTPSTPSGPQTAPLSRISPFLHPVSHSTEAEIDLANPDGRLKPGMFVSVDVFYGESENATLVPLSALYEHPATGETGVYVSRATLSGEPAANPPAGEPATLLGPVTFEFVPVEVVAKGRMEAGIRGVKPDSWIITLGQNLLAGAPGDARVRPVSWTRVEQLQHLQRQDLMEEVIKRQQEAEKDSIAVEQPQTM